MHLQVLGGDFGHALFDGGQILGGERPRVREIVKEPVLDHRTDGHLGVGEQLLNRVGQQVRGGVANDVEALRSRSVTMLKLAS